MTLLRLLLVLAGLGVAGAVGLLGVLVASLAETVGGRLWAVGVLLAAVALVAVTCCFVHGLRRRRKVLCVLGLFYASASGVTLWACARVSPVAPADGGGEVRWSWGRPARVPDPADLVPEPDQIRVGTWLMPYFDQTVTSDVALQLGRAFGRAYERMQLDDPSFALGPSALPEAYRAWLGVKPRRGPVFVYPGAAGGGSGPGEPATADGNRAGGGGEAGDGPMQPARAIVFFHGSPGNLKIGAWLWKHAVDGRGLAVVAATSGSGEWGGDLGQRGLEEALAACSANPAIREDGLVLVGLGRGVEGVLRAAEEVGERADEIVLISPDIGSERIRSDEVRDRLMGKRVLIVHGKDDLRKPIGELHDDADWLWENGVWVWLTQIDGDHHAFWTGGDTATSVVVDWLGGA